jgi:hypothetical protein
MYYSVIFIISIQAHEKAAKDFESLESLKVSVSCFLASRTVKFLSNEIPIHTSFKGTHSVNHYVSFFWRSLHYFMLETRQEKSGRNWFPSFVIFLLCLFLLFYLLTDDSWNKRKLSWKETKRLQVSFSRKGQGTWRYHVLVYFCYRHITTFPPHCHPLCKSTSHHCDKQPKVNNLKEERLILLHSVRSFSP